MTPMTSMKDAMEEADQRRSIHVRTTASVLRADRLDARADALAPRPPDVVTDIPEAQQEAAA